MSTTMVEVITVPLPLMSFVISRQKQQVRKVRLEAQQGFIKKTRLRVQMRGTDQESLSIIG